MRVAVYGGTGLVGASVCKALIACGCAVTSISRTPNTPVLERFSGEQWISQVNWMEADVTADGAAAEVLGDGVDAVVSCIGSSSRAHGASSIRSCALRASMCTYRVP